VPKALRTLPHVFANADRFFGNDLQRTYDE